MADLPTDITSMIDSMFSSLASLDGFASNILFLNHYDLKIVLLSYFLFVPIAYHILRNDPIDSQHKEVTERKAGHYFFMLTHVTLLSIGFCSILITSFFARDISITYDIQYEYLFLALLFFCFTNYADIRLKEQRHSFSTAVFLPSLIFAFTSMISFHLIALALLETEITLLQTINSILICFLITFPILLSFLSFSKRKSTKSVFNISLLLSVVLATFTLFLVHHLFLKVFGSYANISIAYDPIPEIEKFDLSWQIILWNLFLFAGFFFWSQASKDVDAMDLKNQQKPYTQSLFSVLLLFIIGAMLSLYISLVLFQNKTDQSQLDYQETITFFKENLHQNLNQKQNDIEALNAFFASSNFVDKEEFSSFIKKLNLDQDNTRNHTFLFAPIFTKEGLNKQIKQYSNLAELKNKEKFIAKYKERAITTPALYIYTTSVHPKKLSPEDLLRHYNFQKITKQALQTKEIAVDYLEKEKRIVFAIQTENKTLPDTALQKGILVFVSDLNTLISSSRSLPLAHLDVQAQPRDGYIRDTITFAQQEIPFYVKRLAQPSLFRSPFFYKTFLTGFTLVVLFCFYLLTILQQRSRDHKFQKQIDRQRKLFTTILENMPLGIFVKDAQNDYKYTIVNKYAETFLNRPMSDVLNKTDYEIFNERHGALIRSQDEDVMNNKCVIYRDEETFSVNDGITEEIFTARSIQVPIYNDDGGSAILLNIYEDVTEKAEIRRDLIKAKEQAEKSNITKSEFLASMSHELRTPLNSIIGLSKVLSKENDWNPEEKEMINTISQASLSLLHIVNDILDLSKVEAGKVMLDKDKFILKENLDKTFKQLEPLAKEKELKFNINIDPSIDSKQHYYADIHRLSRAIINVVGNAIKYTEKGEVSIDSKVVLLPEREEYDIFKIAVTDTGIGIAPDKIDTIFESFTQADATIERKFGGTGLGLSITKKILEIMDGHISVESTLGKGSCFTIQIPLQKVSESSDRDKLELIEQEKDVKLENYRILIAEDQEFNNVLMKVLLKKYNLKDYTICLNGVQVLDEIVKSEEGYDLILMDCHMPEMDGYKASNAIRERNIKSRSGDPIPIIALTADVTSGIKQKCYDSGMNDYLSKPLDEAVFIKKIKKYL